MTAWRQAIELSIADEDLAKLASITRSRTESASRVERARMLLAYREDPSFFAVGHALGVHHQTVQRCVERALACGPMAALDDRPRLGQEPSDAVAIVSYDEKPGIQAIANTAPDLPPEPGRHATFARDHEYKRHGTVSLLAGIDLLTGQVHALVKDRHRSREFIEFLKILDAAYPAHTAIKLILDIPSAHIPKKTKACPADHPAGRFEFTFTPKHGSWLNLVEGFFSKLTRSVLHHIRVTSKQELKDRIMAAMDEFNRHPVVHTWSYKLDKAA